MGGDIIDVATCLGDILTDEGAVSNYDTWFCMDHKSTFGEDEIKNNVWFEQAA